MEKLLSFSWTEVVTAYGPAVLQVLVVLLVAALVLRFLKPYCGRFFWICRVLVWTFALIVILGQLGYDITSLIAGLGVGGIALALAAQETLSNAFGYLALLIDKPFKIGHKITIDKYTGTVVSMGLRSTRIETAAHIIVSIPNKTMAALPIENLTQK